MARGVLAGLAVAGSAAFVATHQWTPERADLLVFVGALLFWPLYVTADSHGAGRAQVLGLGELALAPVAAFTNTVWALVSFVCGAVAGMLWRLGRRTWPHFAANVATITAATSLGLLAASPVPRSGLAGEVVAGLVAVVVSTALTTTAVSCTSAGVAVDVPRESCRAVLRTGAAHLAVASVLGTAVVVGMRSSPHVTLGFLASAVVVTPLVNYGLTARLEANRLRFALVAVSRLLDAEDDRVAERMLVDAARRLTGCPEVALTSAGAAPPETSAHRVITSVPSGSGPHRYLVVDGLWQRRFAAPHDSLRSLAMAAASALNAADARRRLALRAERDPLTGLLNRAAFEESVTACLGEPGTSGRGGTLCYLDLDRFKRVNDRFGHQAGDRVLQAVSLALSACLRRDDLLARMGGDEFCVYLPHEPTPVSPDLVRHRLSAAVRAACRELPEAREISVSIGIAAHPEDGDDLDALLHAADGRMYDDKRGGPAPHAAAQQW